MTEKTLYAIARHWHSGWIAMMAFMTIAGLWGWYEAVDWKESLVFATIAAYWLHRIDVRLGVLLSMNEEDKTEEKK